jgi:hypothetical protein
LDFPKAYHAESAFSQTSIMGDWLATLGSWLVTPARVVLHPWWERLVEKKAEAQAIRAKLLEAIVGFRVGDFQRRTESGDSDRAHGLALRVAERLRPIIAAAPDADVAEPTTLARIEREIELHAVSLQDWANLACLAESDTFHPRHFINVQFTDGSGGQSHSVSQICALQRAWPFTNILALATTDRGRLSGPAISLLDEYCGRVSLPAVSFQISANMPAPGIVMNRLAGATQLPFGWKPKGQMGNRI